MAVASQTASGSGTFVSVASVTWSHIGSAATRCIVVFVVTYANAGVDNNSSVTHGGVTVPAVTGGFAADTATEPGCVKAYFLDGCPTGTQNIIVSRTNNAVAMVAWAETFTADTPPCEVYLPGLVVIQENAAYSEQSITDGSPGTDSVRVACGYYGGATPQPVGANSTIIASANDQTAFGASACRETAAGQGARLVGFTQATSDDHASVYFAVREVPASSGTTYTKSGFATENRVA